MHLSMVRCRRLVCRKFQDFTISLHHQFEWKVKIYQKSFSEIANDSHTLRLLKWDILIILLTFLTEEKNQYKMFLQWKTTLPEDLQPGLLQPESEREGE